MNGRDLDGHAAGLNRPARDAGILIPPPGVRPTRRLIESTILFCAIFLVNLRGLIEAPWFLILFSLILVVSFQHVVMEPLGFRDRYAKYSVLSHHKAAAVMVWLFIGWTGLTYVHGSLSGSYPFFSSFLQFFVAIGLFYLILRVPVELPARRPVGATSYHLGAVMFWSLLAYLSANLVLWAAGVKTSTPLEFDPGEARLLGILGISIRRVQFPLDASVNRVAATAACLFMLAITCFRDEHGPRKWAKVVLGVGIALALLVLCDARGAMLACVVAPWLMSQLSRAWVRRVLPWAIVALPALPGAVYLVFDMLPRDFVLDVISRSNYSTGAAAASSGRVYIWSAVLDRIYLDPGLHTLIGFGHMGHATSRVSQEYAWIFHSIAAVPFTTHNVYLQTVIDRGLVGLVLLGGVLFLLARVLCRQAGAAVDHMQPVATPVRVALGLLVTLVITASNEVILTAYAQDSILLLLVIAATALNRPSAIDRQSLKEMPP